jgi:kynurenine formamidase
MDMINLKKYRIIDLSQHLRPGICRIDGSYEYGGGMHLEGVIQHRRLELREFTYLGGNDSMHFIETETHIGTHVEAPYHVTVDFGKTKKSISEFPPDNWIGEAIVFDFSDKKTINGKRIAITPEDLEEVKKSDIVLMGSRLRPDERPYISKGAAEFLAKRKIKQLGWDDGVEIGLEPMAKLYNHNLLLKSDICLIEGLVNLDKIEKKRVFYIGLGLSWYGLDSSPIRAIVLEEIH